MSGAGAYVFALVVVLTALLVIAMVVAGAFAALRAQHRAYDRKEQMYLARLDNLLDRTMYATGNVWTPPPVTSQIVSDEYAGPGSVPRERIFTDPETMVDPDGLYDGYLAVPERDLA